MAVRDPAARRFYEEEAVKGGWSVRQLDRQIATRFYDRLRGSSRRGALLAKAHVPTPADLVTPDELVRDPYVLEFLGLADEYGENDLEEAIIRHLEAFLLELGRGFAFVSRQQKIRVDDQWYKIDLLLFHRRLRCLVVIGLKIGRFTHADAGQMNLCLNYAKEHLAEPGGEPAGRADPVQRGERDGGPVRDRRDQRPGVRVRVPDGAAGRGRAAGGGRADQAGAGGPRGRAAGLTRCRR